MAQPTQYTFTNTPGKGRYSFRHTALLQLEEGESVTLPRDAVDAIHAEIVNDPNNNISVSPDLPPDLQSRGRSSIWKDREWIDNIDRVIEKNNKFMFDPSAVAVGSAGGDPVEIALYLQDADDNINSLDSFESVDISVNVGEIAAVSGKVSEPDLPATTVRAQVTSGVIVIQVQSADPQTVTVSIANPETAGLTVTDTHEIVFS